MRYIVMLLMFFFSLGENLDKINVDQTVHVGVIFTISMLFSYQCFCVIRDFMDL